MSEEFTKLKQGLIMALKFTESTCSIAAVVNPIFGVAASLVRVVHCKLDADELTSVLQREFDSVNLALDSFIQKNQDTLMNIKENTVDIQLHPVRENIKNQHRTFMEMVTAPKEQHKSLETKFKKSYENDMYDQNLQTLYEGVTGKSKVFSRPILEVYLKHSQGNRATMEQLCARLTYLFCIGLIALMGYAAVTNDDVMQREEDWTMKMEHVQEKMQEALNSCK